MRKQLILGMASVLAAALVVAGSAGAAAKSKCPSGGTPPPGSKVNGGLEVDGTCILVNVTVGGGIDVDATGHLSQQGGVATGGIKVTSGGELDVNATTNGTGIPTGTTSTINGGIAITGGSVGLSDFDIWTARISGGISVSGPFPLASPFICGNDIHGGVTLDGVTTSFQFFLGDPDAGFGCTGNTIHGTVSVSNSSLGAVESNTVNGSVLLSASKLEFNGNTITGSALCSNGTVIVPGEPPDPPGNTVGGTNTC